MSNCLLLEKSYLSQIVKFDKVVNALLLGTFLSNGEIINSQQQLVLLLVLAHLNAFNEQNSKENKVRRTKSLAEDLSLQLRIQSPSFEQ